ncbi:DUF5995 family protein [Brumimicrobium mesophilum]|uniref:DUF5995 family protein n=1 Tax=Brumimicrobium mesophilum TaxID=392717 RepID=UPI000D13FF22|nr:DUF5995 family protein [Brumimicrobium mesophilum]
MSRATTIQQVLDQLDVIIEDCIANNSRLGLFAYIYRRTTAEIAAEIALGNFENNQRLEDMDVVFANLYLDAYKDYKNGQLVSTSWAFAFDQENEPLTILQHIMLGMNAHINLDLGVATASTMSGQEILEIEADFNKVNDILFQIVNEMQDRLSRVTPMMFILDWLGKNNDEKAIDFSMRKARQQSWNSANLLWSLGGENNKETINNLDNLVLKLSQVVKAPKSKFLRFLLKFMHKFETKEVNVILTRLKSD